MPLKALIFDVDGTLAETEAAHLQAFNQVFKAQDLNWHWSKTTYLQLLKISGGKERIAHYIQQQQPHFSHPQLSHFIQSLHQQKTQHYIELIKSGQVPLRIGVKRLLDAAKAANIRLAIATTSQRANVEALIESQLGCMSKWFEVVIAGDEVANKKPAADVYIKVLKTLQLSPKDCIAIEDSDNGLLSATTAHIPTLITRSPYSPFSNIDAATLVIDSLGEPNQASKLEQGNLFGHQYITLSLLQTIAETT